MQPKPNRTPGLITGLCIFALGLLCALPLFFHSKDNSNLGTLAIFAPLLIIWGLVTTIRALISGSSAFSGHTILFTGLVMLIFGIFPWAYTPFLLGDTPGNEGAGMLGTLIFLFVGLPGIFVTLTGILVCISQKKR